MDIDVTSVARKEQKLTHTAAAAYVVTQDDIRRSGATSIPEALRMVPGVQVARIDSSRWVVSARGFDSRFSNKMLVLIDGRSIYNHAYAGVSWDQYDLVLEDIERIEVIRGPGATMWGANAVNGVINIITKTAENTQGVLASLTTGNEDLATSALRYGGKKGERLRYRLFGKQITRNHLVTDSVLDARDSWNMVRGGGRVDFDWSEHDTITLHGDTYRGGAGQRYYTTYLATDPGNIREDRIATSGGYLMGRWLHREESGAETALQVYYNSENRAEALAALDMQTLDFDFQQRRPSWKRHELMWGLGYRSYWDHTPRNAWAALNPSSRQENLQSGFLQDEFSILPERLVATVGAKLQHNRWTGFDLQPSARVFWELHPNHSLWAAASQAVRTPSRWESDAAFQYQFAGPDSVPLLAQFTGNRNPRSETLRAYELGYRTQLSNRLAIDLTAFRNHYENLQSISLGTPHLEMAPSPHIAFPATYTYAGRAGVYGAELATTWNLRPTWKLTGNYAWLHTNIDQATNVGAYTQVASLGAVYPSHQSFVRSSFSIARFWTLDASLYFLSAMHGNPVQANTRLDLRLGWRPSERVEWSFGLANLLDPQHPEFTPDGYDARAQVPRSVYVRLTWGQ